MNISEFDKHGNFKVEIKGNLIHSYISEGFDKEGIKKYCDEVLRIAKPIAQWCLLEHIENSAGLTPEALKELKKTYNIFALNGCKVIALNIGILFGSIISNNILDDLTIPTFYSEKIEECNNFIEKIST